MNNWPYSRFYYYGYASCWQSQNICLYFVSYWTKLKSLRYLLNSFARVYSQCASTTLRGTLSSGKLTARRVREAVSSSSSRSSSSLSRSTALWPMAAHRRHFLFHTTEDVTCKHIQRTWFCCITSNILYSSQCWSQPYNNEQKAVFPLCSYSLLLFQQHFQVTHNGLAGLWTSELSVAVLGFSPAPLPASAVEGKVSQMSGGVPWCVLDAVEVHSVRNTMDLLSMYICALTVLSWVRLTLISTE